MAIIRSYNADTWAQWTRIDNNYPIGENDGPRWVEEYVRLPYSRPVHIGIGNSGTEGILTPTQVSAVGGEVKARWRIGQFYTSESDDNSRINRMSIGTGDEQGQKLVHGVATTRSTASDWGFYSPIRNSFGIVSDDSFINYPKAATKFYVSCWIKSQLTDYSDYVGYIILHENQNHNIRYTFYIDTDNKIKAALGGATTLLFDSDVVIDENWHNLLLVADSPGVGKSHYLFVDNVLQDTVVGDSAEISGSNIFSVGSQELSSSHIRGFAGFIDEITIGEWSGTFLTDSVENHKFDTVIVQSSVFDTENTNNLLAQIMAVFEAPSNSSISFSFRGSKTTFDADDTDISWTGYTLPSQIQTTVRLETASLGISVKGRYQQIRIKMSPSFEVGTFTHIATPILKSVEFVYSSEGFPLALADTVYRPGTMLSQRAEFSGIQTIDKVSLNLNINTEDEKQFITGQNDVVSFSAANFSDGRETTTFQPKSNFGGNITWITSGTTITNSLQSENYSDDDDVILNAPYLKYSIIFAQAGVYELWGYGYTNASVYWNFDNDTTEMRSMNLGLGISGYEDLPYWTKFGHFEVKEGSLHDFYIYLGENKKVLLDQWYFTSNYAIEDQLNEVDNGFTTPLPITPSPFNSAVRLRPLVSGEINTVTSQFFEDDGDEDPYIINTSITVWKPSRIMRASGKFNYQIPDGMIFIDGCVIDFWQVGGSAKHYASWNYTFDDDMEDNSKQSEDYGETYE